jgi:hypothetical protein
MQSSAAFITIMFGFRFSVHTGIKTMTIGFPTPLLYKRSLRFAVTVSEPGVAQIVANVIHGGA